MKYFKLNNTMYCTSFDVFSKYLDAMRKLRFKGLTDEEYKWSRMDLQQQLAFASCQIVFDQL